MVTTYDDLEDLKISPRSRLLLARSVGVCGWSPYPNYGGYKHWYCQRRKRHIGVHRFENYVAGRVFRRQVHYKPTLKPSYAWSILKDTT